MRFSYGNNFRATEVVLLGKLGRNEVLKFMVFSWDNEIANKEIIKDIIKILNN
jgi:hypothetical protein